MERNRYKKAKNSQLIGNVGNRDGFNEPSLTLLITATADDLDGKLKV
jgi:hypothetical protein